MGVAGDIVRGFKAEVGGRILYFATTGVVLIFLARYLEPSAYGVVFLTLSLLAVAQLFAELSIPRSAARYVTEYEELDSDHIGYIVTFSFVVIVTAMSLVAGFLVAFNRQIAGLFGEPALRGVLLVGAVMVVCRTLYQFFRRILQGFKMIRPSAAVYGMEGIGRLVFVVAFVLLGFGTVGAVGGYALGFGSAAVLGGVLFYYYIYPSLDVTLDGDPKIRNRVLRYAVPLLGIRSAEKVDNSFDTVLVGFFLAPAAVGFYSLSKQAVHLLQAPASALGFSAGPWFGDQKASGNVDRVAELYAASLVYTLAFYVPVAAGLALLARPMLVFVFGEGYLPATDVLRILSVLAVLQGIEELSENAIDYLGRARERSVTKGASVLLSFGAMVVLIPAIGIVGAAIAKVVTHALYVATLLYIMFLEIGYSVRFLGRETVKVLLVTGAMSVAVFLASRFVSGLVTLAAVVLLGGAIWAVLVVALGLVDTDAVTSIYG